MQDFKALRIHSADGGIEPRLENISLDDLNAGEVVIRCAWSGVNYKDALAVTGAGKISSSPLILLLTSSWALRVKAATKVPAAAEATREKRFGFPTKNPFLAVSSSFLMQSLLCRCDEAAPLLCLALLIPQF